MEQRDLTIKNRRIISFFLILEIKNYY